MTRSKPTGELVSLIDNSSIKKRCEKVSQKKNYWLGIRARSDEQHVAVIQHNKAKKAAKKSHKRAAASTKNLNGPGRESFNATTT